MSVNDWSNQTNVQMVGQRVASGHDGIGAEGIKKIEFHISSVGQDTTETVGKSVGKRLFTKPAVRTMSNPSGIKINNG